ncbi:MAG: hypothetical protein ACF8AM_21440 [Rhodopirellula sp. JB055]
MSATSASPSSGSTATQSATQSAQPSRRRKRFAAGYRLLLIAV